MSTMSDNEGLIWRERQDHRVGFLHARIFHRHQATWGSVWPPSVRNSVTTRITSRSILDVIDQCEGGVVNVTARNTG